MSSRVEEHEVVILGGGLAGLTLALQILRRRPQTSLTVIERADFPVTEAAHKVGEATVENGAHYFREVLGLEDHLSNEQIRKMGLRFFATAADNASIAARLEAGPRHFLPGRSFQLDRGRFENELARRAAALGAVIRDGARVRSVELDGEGMHRVSVSSEQGEEWIAGRWVVDASGRRALLKQKLGLAESVDHDVNAVWFRLGEMITLDDFIDVDPSSVGSAEREAWRERVPTGERWRSTNHLHGPGYWAWLIPLASGAVSVGIVADSSLVPFAEINSFEKALAWLGRNEPQLAVAVERAQASLKDFRMLRHYAHGCKQVFSAERWCLTGEAGVFLDPLYSPGSDFIGLSNTYITDLIVRELAGEDVGARAKRYNEDYLEAFASALPVWQWQYPLMGHPQIWAAKVAWDTLTYFATTCLLFVNDALTDLELMDSLEDVRERWKRLSARIQRFFREWASIDSGAVAPHGFVDLSEPLYERLNGELLERLDPEQVRRRLHENVELVEGLAIELLRGAAQRLGVELTGEIDPLAFDLGELAAAGSGSSNGLDPGPGIADGLAGVWQPGPGVARAAP